jgi:hypothetical protein
MKTMFKAALAATLATGLFAAPAFAASAGTSTFGAKAVIVKPVTITKVKDLDFGTTVMNSSLTSAKVTVGDATGSVAVCSDTAMLTCSGGFPASFNLTAGVRLQTVQISFDVPPTQLNHTTITGASVPFALDAVENVTLDTNGEGSFNVGGEITVASSTADGTYTGTVNIVANYH